MVAIFALGSAGWSRARLSADPVVVRVAATEIRAIERDFRNTIEAHELPCGKHERLNAMAKRPEVFIYSFGPNRGRDSSKWKLGGDDIGVICQVRKNEAPRAEEER